MTTQNDSGAPTVADIATKHGFSAEAAQVMLDAMERSGGGMAQFSHREFGGHGQWMRGGMTQVGDMFNHQLKGRVDALCNDLAALVGKRAAGRSESAPPSHSQPPSQEAPPAQPTPDRLTPSKDAGSAAGRSGSPAGQRASSGGDWWPGDLGRPNSSGGQNDMRYAYFAASRRLAVDRAGSVTVYDTGEHQIGGVTQQQSSSGSMTFTSQHGTVDLQSLRQVSAG